MRATIVAGLGGLIVGHMLWLVAISIATKTTTVNAWVLVLAAASFALAIVGGLLGRMLHRRRAVCEGGVPVVPARLPGAVLDQRARGDLPIATQAPQTSVRAGKQTLSTDDGYNPRPPAL